jgi:hypothetical protein
MVIAHWAMTAADALCSSGVVATVIGTDEIDCRHKHLHLAIRRIGGGYWVYYNQAGRRLQIETHGHLDGALRDVRGRLAEYDRRWGPLKGQ